MLNRQPEVCLFLDYVRSRLQSCLNFHSVTTVLLLLLLYILLSIKNRVLWLPLWYRFCHQLRCVGQLGIRYAIFLKLSFVRSLIFGQGSVDVAFMLPCLPKSLLFLLAMKTDYESSQTLT